MYHDLISYISIHKLDDDALCEIKMDILSIALNAQQRGESLSEVIGEDIKEFCDEIVGESKKKPISVKVSDAISNMIYFICFYFILSILMNAAIDINYLMKFTLGHVLFIIITFVEFKFLLYRLRLKGIDNNQNDRYTMIGLIGLVILALSGILFVKFYSIVLFTLNIWIFIPLILFALLIRLVIIFIERK